jgi:hypothetical protein
MTRALVTLPLPGHLLADAGIQAQPLRALLAEAGSSQVFLERGEKLLGVRNAPPTAKAGAGLAEIRGYRHAIVALPGDLVDHRAALSALHPHLCTHLLPLVPGNADLVKVAWQRLVEEFEPSPAPQSTGDYRLLARSLEEHARRQRQGQYPSAEWRRFLLGLLLGGAPPLPVPDEKTMPARVALLGGLAGPSDLIDYIEMFGGRVVYDEWLELSSELFFAEHPFEALANTPLVAGLAAREERINEILDGVDAIILIVEPFCASALEEAWVRSAFRKPILVIEADGLGHLDATRVMRLENFAALAFAGKGGGQQP